MAVNALRKLVPEILGSVRCPVGLPLVHHAGGPIEERPVANVRVPDHPAHIGRHPPNILLVQPVNGLHCPTNGHQVSTDRPHDPFRLTCDRKVRLTLVILPMNAADELFRELLYIHTRPVRLFNEFRRA